MTSSSLGFDLLQITDSTGLTIFAAQLAGVKVTTSEGFITLQCEHIKDMFVKNVEVGSEVIKQNVIPLEGSLDVYNENV